MGWSQIIDVPESDDVRPELVAVISNSLQPAVTVDLDHMLQGLRLVRGQTYGSISLAGGALVLQGCTPGACDYGLELVDDGAVPAAATYDSASQTISVSYDGPANGDTATWADIHAEITGLSALDRVLLVTSWADPGAGSVPALARTTPSGHTGGGVRVYVGGLQQRIAQEQMSVSGGFDVIAYVVVDNFPWPLVTPGWATFYVETDGVRSLPLTVPVAS